MNKLKYILLCCIGILAISSCSSDDEDTTAMYYNWQVANDLYFSEIFQQATDSIKAGNKHWYKLMSYAKADSTNQNNFVVVKVLSQKTEHQEVLNGTKNTTYSLCPTFKDTVTVTYRGNLIPFEHGTVYAEEYNSVLGPDNFEVGYTFETHYFGNNMDVSQAVFTDITASSTVGGADGFGTALLYMHPGDRWRVFIPYNLGYGSTDQSSIPAYSTLIFDLYMDGFRTNQK